MISKTMLKWVGVAGLVALGACAPTGPLSECVMGDDNIQTCTPSTPQPEPAEGGIEQIIQ